MEFVLAALFIIFIALLVSRFSWKKKYISLQHNNEKEESNLNSRISKMRREAEEAVKVEAKLIDLQKRLQASQAQFTKRKYILDSIADTAGRYASATSNSESEVRRLFIQSSQDFEPVVYIELKSLTQKDLRARYRDNEKRIRDLCKMYEDKYTTKVNTTIYRLVVFALEEGLLNILSRLSFGKLDDAIAKVQKLTGRCFDIAIEGNQTIVNTLSRFIGQVEYLYIEAVKIEYEYYVKRERAKEEQRAIREQMRQEAEERKILEQQRRQVESEEKKYHNEISRLQDQVVASVEDDVIAALKQRIVEVEALLDQVEVRKEEIITLQNGKAGTVYVISNLGAFGDKMFKIGMTRRIEPMDRVRELGDASVPFPFDVHSMIFSEDAVTLESQLHKELARQRVNKINLRKEFFKVDINALEELVTRIDPTATFEHTMVAEQYHQSLSIDIPPDESTIDSIPDEAEDDLVTA